MISSWWQWMLSMHTLWYIYTVIHIHIYIYLGPKEPIRFSTAFAVLDAIGERKNWKSYIDKSKAGRHYCIQYQSVSGWNWDCIFEIFSLILKVPFKDNPLKRRLVFMNNALVIKFTHVWSNEEPIILMLKPWLQPCTPFAYRATMNCAHILLGSIVTQALGSGSWSYFKIKRTNLSGCACICTSRYLIHVETRLDPIWLT